MRVVLDKAEAAGSFGVLVQSHDDSLHVADPLEKLVYLFFGGEEREITHIEGGGGSEFCDSPIVFFFGHKFTTSEDVRRNFAVRHTE